MTTNRGPIEFLDLSKLFLFVMAPSHLLVWTAAVGMVFERRLFGCALFTLETLGFLALMLLLIGDWATSTIKNQNARGLWPVRVNAQRQRAAIVIQRSRAVP
jgi:hypothetical protein